MNARNCPYSLTIDQARRFLICLVKIERHVREAVVQVECSELANQLKNWIHVLSLMIRKMSAQFLGETDHDFEIKGPLFVLSPQTEAKGEVI